MRWQVYMLQSCPNLPGNYFFKVNTSIPPVKCAQKKEKKKTCPKAAKADYIQTTISLAKKLSQCWSEKTKTKKQNSSSQTLQC